MGRCGERTERCRWQRKRSERVAAVKILSVRRKAAQKFWAPQQDHRPLRKRILWCVGEGLCPARGRPQGSPLRSFTRSALRADRGVRPYGWFPARTSQGLPTPFLHISCSLCVDSLWINFPSPFLSPSCGNPSFPLWTKNPCISRPCGGFPQKFSLRLLLLKNT